MGELAAAGGANLMCGIAGYASSIGGAGVSLDAMMQRIAHRGPDDAGVRVSDDGGVGLGHRRLAIIDLSPAGHQPMTATVGRLWLTFNGEIYNYLDLRAELESLGSRFQSGSDSEVILHAYHRWGKRCVERLNGMFAFVLHDEEAETLFIARDRLGKKPLFWYHDGTTFLFASEAKALVAARTDREWPLDPQALNAFLAFGYIPGERSIFANVRRLPPGWRMTYDLRRSEISSEPYWLPESALAQDRESDQEVLLGELEALLDDSVRLRMIADVPLGVLLSGGVDSSLITAIAARHSTRPVKTFTVTFPGGGKYDESRHARTIAEHFGTEHHELPLPQADLDVLRALAHHLDEPLADPSVLPTYLISKLTREHVTVALGGDGGDELFGGYAWYRQGMQVRRTLRHVPHVVRAAAAAAADFLPPGVRGRNYIRARADDLCHYLITTNTVFDLSMRRQLLRPDVLAKIVLEGPETEKRSRWPEDSDPVRAMSLFDIRGYLPDDILIKVDRASMAVALEMRAPLLDYRIVEFALGRVPAAMKVTAFGSRFLQRELGRRLLPRTLDLDRKQGFVMPIHEWLRGGWGDATVEALNDPAVTRWIDGSLAASLLEGQRKGRTNGVRLFTLLMLALWLQGVASKAPSLAACEAAA